MVHFLVHEVILWYMRWDIESLEKRMHYMPKLVKNLIVSVYVINIMNNGM